MMKVKHRKYVKFIAAFLFFVSILLSWGGMFYVTNVAYGFRPGAVYIYESSSEGWEKRRSHQDSVNSLPMEFALIFDYGIQNLNAGPEDWLFIDYSGAKYESKSIVAN